MDNMLSDFADLYSGEDRKYSDKIDDILIENEPINDFLSLPMFDSNSTDLNTMDDDDDEYNLIKIKQEALLLHESEEKITEFDINDYINIKTEESTVNLKEMSDSNSSKQFEACEEILEIGHIEHLAEEQIYDQNVENSMDAIYNLRSLEPETESSFKERDADDYGGLFMNDHNYMSQEIVSDYDDTVSIKNLRNQAEKLRIFANNYKTMTEWKIKSNEISTVVEDIEEILHKLKKEIKEEILEIRQEQISEYIIAETSKSEERHKISSNDLVNNKIILDLEIPKASENIENNILDNENHTEKCGNTENALNQEVEKKIEDNLIQEKNVIDKANSLITSDENAKTIAEKSSTDKLINEKNNEKMNLFEHFGKTMVDACNKYKSNKDNLNENDFFNGQIKEIQNFLRLVNKNVEQSTQAECVGNLLDYLNNEEKKRLLEDVSESSDQLDLESDTSSSDTSESSSSNTQKSKSSTENRRGKNIYESSEEASVDNNENKNVSKRRTEKTVENKEKDEDKEIDRLLNYKHLANKKELDYVTKSKNTDKSSAPKSSNPETLIDILEQNKHDSIYSDDSDNEIEELPTENDFLLRTNEDLKKQMLESSSDSDSQLSSIDLPDQNDDDSNTSLVDKFLESYAEAEGNDLNEHNNIKEKISNELSNQDKKDTDSYSDKENNFSNKIDEFSDGKNIDNDEDDLLDKTLPQNLNKKKSFETLLKEDEKRRKNNLKPNEDHHISLSSDEESDLSSTEITPINRTLRPIMRQDQLASETKVAQKEETQRISRLKKKQEILKKAYKEHKIDQSDINSLILDYNTKTKKFIQVHPELLKKLKQHQIDGVKFMYDCCYGSVNFLNEHPGSGCILAHCMGLGKTLQLITILHTVIVHKELKTSKVLVLCPKSTVMNWSDEILQWLGPVKTKNLKIYLFSDTYDIKNKLKVLQEWAKCGNVAKDVSGCLLLGYEAFRSLVLYHNFKKRAANLNQSDVDEIQRIVRDTLLDPGPDLVICDEGHIIKNRRAAISQAVQEIKTPRRIILTGTPIQNNLKEYYSMVNFIKPSYLGTEKEFANLYANPIKNGQHKDSSKRDIKIMKQRSFVLHKKLSSFVQRREAALLKTFLPQKFEYVLFIPMTSVQTRLYEIFLDSVGKRNDDTAKGRNLLTDYTCLRKIWTHPKVLENAYQNAINMKQKKDIKKSSAIVQSDDEEPDDIYDSQTGLMSVTNDWWRSHVSKPDLETVLPSNKLQTMFQILKMCQEKNDKCLIFSAFVAVLNVVEYFMQASNNNNSNFKELGIERLKGEWINGKDYYRLDGKTPKTLRHQMIKKFNNADDPRARVFLISAKAGGQGINLIGANRVIILDTSWNPSNDNQNIFRIFRLGQKKCCYVYRLLSMGTMEEKVYSRSVTKQAMSFRVVDEQQIDRHYSMAELAELYALTKPEYSERPVPSLPQDSILANLLRNYPNLVYKYHEHDTLLENKIEQELSEQEKEDAWKAYEEDIVRSEASNFAGLGNLDFFGGPAFPQNFLMDPALMGNPSDLNLWQSLNSFPNLAGANSYLDPSYNLYKNSIYGLDHTVTNPNIQKQMESNYLTRHLAQNYPTTASQLRNLSSLTDLTNNSNPANFLGYSSPYGQTMLNSPQYNKFLMDNMQRILESYNDPKNSNLVDNGRLLANPTSYSVANNVPKNNKRNDPYSTQMRNLENNILEQNKNISNRNPDIINNSNASTAGPSTSRHGSTKNSDKSDIINTNKNISSQSATDSNSTIKIVNVASGESAKTIDSAIDKNKATLGANGNNIRKRPRSTSPSVNSDISDVVLKKKNVGKSVSTMSTNEVYELDD